jgi:chromosome segregation ATPase
MKRSIAVVALTLAALTMGLAIGTRAATRDDQARAAATSPEENVLPALLIEVRGLRAAMEQMASAGPRVQLALGRVQLQEQRIGNLIRRLDETRASITIVQAEHDATLGRARSVENELRDSRPDGTRLTHLQEMQVHVKSELQRVSANLQRVTAEEAAVASELAGEQARWMDLNQRMEALEAALGPR